MNPSLTASHTDTHAIRSDRLKKIRSRDLNSLIILHTILRLRNVSGAARALDMSQPAVSRVLERLRTEFDDPLVIRQGNGVVATKRARELLPILDSLIDQIGSMYTPDLFDPSTAKRDIYVGMNEHLQEIIVPGLLSRIKQTAPGVRILLRSTMRKHIEGLKDGDLDLVIGMLSDDNELRQKPLFRDRMICITNAGHSQKLNQHGPLDLEKFGRLAHIDCEPAALGQFSALLDGLYKKTHRRRNTVCVVSSFHALMNTLETGEYIGVLPELIYRSRTRPFLHEVALDFFMPVYKVSAWWHNVSHHDQLVQWLLNQIEDVCNEFSNPQLPMVPADN